MSLQLASAIAQAKNQLSDAGAWLVLLEIDTPVLDQPLKLVRNTEDIVWGETGEFERYQDASDWSETDPNSRIDMDSGETFFVEFSSLTNNEDAYFYKDFGAGAFDGDFEFRFEVNISAINATCTQPIWAVSNYLDDTYYWLNNYKSSLFLRIYRSIADVYYLQMFEVTGTDSYYTTYVNYPIDRDVVYFTVKRSDDLGEFGRLTCQIYYDAERTSLITTLTLDLHDKVDFQYLFAIVSCNAGAPGAYSSGSVSNMEVLPGYWYAFPFDLDESKQASDGSIQTLSVRVSNVLREVESYVHEADGAEGTTVTIRVVYSEELGEDAILEETFAVGSIKCNNEWVVFELKPDSFITQLFPRPIFNRGTCKNTFKDRACSYIGTAYTTCNRNLTDCILRDNVEHFRGTPAIPDGKFDETGIVPSYGE